MKASGFRLSIRLGASVLAKLGGGSRRVSLHSKRLRDREDGDGVERRPTGDGQRRRYDRGRPSLGRESRIASNRSGLALPYRQTVHIVARRRRADRHARALSICRIPARPAGVQIFRPMRAHGVLLFVVVPALPFAGLGSPLGCTPAPFPLHLFDQPDLPHFSAPMRRDRPDVLERSVVLSPIDRLLAGAEIVGDARRGAERSLDDPRRTDFLPLPALCPGADVAGDAIAPRCRDAGAGLSRLVRRDRGRAARGLAGIALDDARVPPLCQLVRRRRPFLCADRQRPHPFLPRGRLGRRDRAARLSPRHAFLSVRAHPPRPMDGGIGGAGRVAVLLRRRLPVCAARRRRDRLRPSPPLGIAAVARHAGRLSARDRRTELRRLSRPHADDRSYRVPIWLRPVAVLRRHRRDFRCSGGAFSADRKASDRVRL
jgi:hypothetical protein